MSSNRSPASRPDTLNCLLSDNTLVQLQSSYKFTLYTSILNRIHSDVLVILPTRFICKKLANHLRNTTRNLVVPHTEPQTQCVVPTNVGALLTTVEVLLENHQSRNSLRQATWRLIVFDDIAHLEEYRGFMKDNFPIPFVGTAPPRVVAMVQTPLMPLDLTRMERLARELTISQVLTLEPLGSFSSPNARPIRDAVHTPHIVDIRHKVRNTVDTSVRMGSNSILKFVERVSASQATPLATDLFYVVMSMEIEVTKLLPAFNSPLFNEEPAYTWARYSSDMFSSSLAGGESDRICDMLYSITRWYVALRLVVDSWECADWSALLFLRLVHCDHKNSIAVWPQAVEKYLNNVFKVGPTNHQVLFRLRRTLIQNASALVPARVLVFVDCAMMAHVVLDYIEHEPELADYVTPALAYDVDNADPMPFILSADLVNKNVRAFKKNAVSVLVTTRNFATGMFFSFLLFGCVRPRFVSIVCHWNILVLTVSPLFYFCSTFLSPCSM